MADRLACAFPVAGLDALHDLVCDRAAEGAHFSEDAVHGDVLVDRLGLVRGVRHFRLVVGRGVQLVDFVDRRQRCVQLLLRLPRLVGCGRRLVEARRVAVRLTHSHLHRALSAQLRQDCVDLGHAAAHGFDQLGDVWLELPDNAAEAGHDVRAELARAVPQVADALVKPGVKLCQRVEALLDLVKKVADERPLDAAHQHALDAGQLLGQLAEGVRRAAEAERAACKGFCCARQTFQAGHGFLGRAGHGAAHACDPLAEALQVRSCAGQRAEHGLAESPPDACVRLRDRGHSDACRGLQLCSGRCELLGGCSALPVRRGLCEGRLRGLHGQLRFVDALAADEGCVCLQRLLRALDVLRHLVVGFGRCRVYERLAGFAHPVGGHFVPLDLCLRLLDVVLQALPLLGLLACAELLEGVLLVVELQQGLLCLLDRCGGLPVLVCRDLLLCEFLQLLPGRHDLLRGVVEPVVKRDHAGRGFEALRRRGRHAVDLRHELVRPGLQALDVFVVLFAVQLRTDRRQLPLDLLHVRCYFFGFWELWLDPQLGCAVHAESPGYGGAEAVDRALHAAHGVDQLIRPLFKAGVVQLGVDYYSAVVLVRHVPSASFQQ